MLVEQGKIGISLHNRIISLPEIKNKEMPNADKIIIENENIRT